MHEASPFYRRFAPAMCAVFLCAALICTLARPSTAQAAMPRADLDGDCIVGFSDFMIIMSHWGASYGSLNYEERLDFDHNGRISIGDLQVVAGSWGQTC